MNPRTHELRKLVNDLLSTFKSTSKGSLGTQIYDHHAEEKCKIMSECTCVLVDSLDEASKSQDKLGNKIFWLNVILTAATVVGTIATIIMASQ